MLLAKGVSHRMRYGAQITMALMLLFASSPFSVYIIYVLRDLWGPMLILVAIRVRAMRNIITLTLHTHPLRHPIQPPTSRSYAAMQRRCTHHTTRLTPC